jgi:hypothetical protein
MRGGGKVKSFTRVLAMGDPHCGHFSGLVPPDRWSKAGTSYGNQQRKMWAFYIDTIKSLGKIDICVSNGDGIDGKGNKSGGTQLLEADRVKQAFMYTEVLKQVKASEYYLTYGTPYHTGEQEDYENITARELKAEVKSHLMLKVRDTVFDIKHKVGGGSLPHTRFTSIAKEKLFNIMWAYNDGQPDAQIVIRSHVHDFNYCGNDSYLAMTIPGLEGFGDKYGVRQCSGIIKIGLVWFDIYDNKKIDWHYAVMKFETVQIDKIIESRLK